MALTAADTGQFLTILFMAIALGMDAFSLGVGIGLKGVRLVDILKISTLIGLFHLMMPLLGVFMGKYMGLLLGDVAVLIGGALLVVLGVHMVYNSLFEDEIRTVNHRSLWGLTLFALSVSIDSLSVGVSLGLFSSDLMLTVLAFGLCGGGMSIFGLLLGRRMGVWFGGYGEALGGAILLAFGVKFLM